MYRGSGTVDTRSAG